LASVIDPTARYDSREAQSLQAPFAYPARAATKTRAEGTIGNRDGQAVHRFEDADDVASLEWQQTVGAPTRASRYRRRFISWIGACRSTPFLRKFEVAKVKNMCSVREGRCLGANRWPEASCAWSGVRCARRFCECRQPILSVRRTSGIAGHKRQLSA